MHNVVKIMAYQIREGAVVVYSSFDEFVDEHSVRTAVTEYHRDEQDGDIFIKCGEDGPSQFFEPGDHLLVDLTETFFPEKEPK